MEETATISFRITRELRDSLRREAEKAGQTLNAFVISCFQKEVEWASATRGFEYAHLSRQILLAFIKGVETEEIAKLGRQLLASRLRDLASLIHGKADLNGFRQIVNLENKYQYTWDVAYSWKEENDQLRLFVRHGLSRKWSIFLGEGYLEYLRSIGINASYEALNNSLKLIINPTSRTSQPSSNKRSFR
jgi:hypothetical protein